MEADRETLHALMKNIETLITENEREDGSYRFDLLRVVVALDFVRSEIEGTISDEVLRMD